MGRLRAHLTVALLFAGATLLVTYPQVRFLGTAIADHPDPYFSIWRLGWVAHQLVNDPRHLFDANIFYPKLLTYAYSDAMLLPATLLAPLFWLGGNPVLIYNAALLGALALSAFTMFLLAYELTANRVASIAAGFIYAFAPYRFEQYIHLEMEMVFWIPLALLVVHRLFAKGRLVDAVLLALLVAAQTMSGMYGAMCFLVCLGVFVPALAIATWPGRWLRLGAVFAAAGLVAAILVAPYALPYLRVQQIAGARDVREILHYGASIANYFAAPPANRLYGWTSARFGGEELHLFPGFIALALGAIGVAAVRSRVAIAYLVMLLVAFEASRGFDGYTYPFLFNLIAPFRGFRVPARFDLIVNLSLGVLAAMGCNWLLQKTSGRVRSAICAVVIAGMLAEYASAPALAEVGGPSLADQWLASQAEGVVAEMPLPTPDRMWPNNESRYMYEGMAHWLPMVNGYSGYFPDSYLELVSVMQTFPDERSLAYLQARGVKYLLVRGNMYDAEAWEKLRQQLLNVPALSIAGFPPPGNEIVFRLQ